MEGYFGKGVFGNEGEEKRGVEMCVLGEGERVKGIGG